MFAAKNRSTLRHFFAATNHLITAFAVVLSLSCSNPRECIAFSDTQLYTWFPYDTTHTYYFSGSNGQIDSMKLNENTATDAYTSGNHFNSEACSAGATMSTGEKPQYIYLNIYETKVNNEVQYADIEVNGLDYFGNCLSDTGYVYSNSHLAHTQYHESLQLNGREFTQVQEIIADTVRNGQTISHFWIAKNKGLVGFEENGNSTIFTLQP